MQNINDILRGRADRLDLGRGDQLASIQEVLNKHYVGRVRAKQLKDGILTISTPSSAVAGDIRLRQVALLKQLKPYTVSDFRVRIE